MSTVVTGKFECQIQAEEALSESLLRFPHEDVVLVPARAAGGGVSFVLIRARRNAERQLAQRTLQGRGAAEVEVVAVPAPTLVAARGPAGMSAALVRRAA